MKSYIKPSIKYVELRLEEGLAAIGSMTVFLKDSRSIANLVSSEDNWRNFWLKILRK